MLRVSRRAARFVRALVAGGVGMREGEAFFALAADGRRVSLDGADVAVLQSAGVLLGNGLRCSAASEARNWLRRSLVEADGFAAQHRMAVRTAEGRILNLAESPLSRLATPGTDGSPPFLAPHQVEAGERVRRLTERAQLQPRVTMSYDPAHTAGGSGAGAAPDLGDIAADARRALGEIAKVLPVDCAGVVLDVCGLLKGLQTVESERGWPRRSAKLVLRIGLEHLAQHYGLSAVATGQPTRRRRSWLGEGARPTRFE